MTKFKKGYNFKIISLLITVTFLLNSTVYGIDISNKAHLRVPVGSQGVYKRMQTALKETQQPATGTWRSSINLSFVLNMLLWGGVFTYSAISNENYLSLQDAYVPSGLILDSSHQQTINGFYVKEISDGRIVLVNDGHKITLSDKENCNITKDAQTGIRTVNIIKDVKNKNGNIIFKRGAIITITPKDKGYKVDITVEVVDYYLRAGEISTNTTVEVVDYYLRAGKISTNKIVKDYSDPHIYRKSHEKKLSAGDLILSFRPKDETFKHYISFMKIPATYIPNGRSGSNLRRDESFIKNAKWLMENKYSETKHTLFINYTGHVPLSTAWSRANIPIYWQLALNDRIADQMQDWHEEIKKNTNENNTNAAIILEPSHGSGVGIDVGYLPSAEEIKALGMSTIVVFSENIFSEEESYSIDDIDTMFDSVFIGYLHNLEKSGIEVKVEGCGYNNGTSIEKLINSAIKEYDYPIYGTVKLLYENENIIMGFRIISETYRYIIVGYKDDSKSGGIIIRLSEDNKIIAVESDYTNEILEQLLANAENMPLYKEIVQELNLFISQDTKRPSGSGSLLPGERTPIQSDTKSFTGKAMVAQAGEQLRIAQEISVLHREIQKLEKKQGLSRHSKARRYYAAKIEKSGEQIKALKKTIMQIHWMDPSEFAGHLFYNQKLLLNSI